MPCNDVTERIELVLDADDRLVSYALRKRTCGRAVGGESLLDTVFTGKTIGDIAGVTPEGLLERIAPPSDIEAFLALKHLFAVQAACAVICGAAAGGPNDICAAAEIGCENGQTRLTGLVRVNVVHDEIKACGRCKGCASKKITKAQSLSNR